MRSEVPSEKRGVLCLVAYFVRLVRRERWKEKQCIRKAGPQSTSQVRSRDACRRWETWPGVSRSHLRAEKDAGSQRYWRVSSLRAPAAIRRLGRGLEHVPHRRWPRAMPASSGETAAESSSLWTPPDGPDHKKHRILQVRPPTRPVLSEATSGRSASPKAPTVFFQVLDSCTWKQITGRSPDGRGSCPGDGFSYSAPGIWDSARCTLQSGLGVGSPASGRDWSVRARRALPEPLSTNQLMFCRRVIWEL